MLTFALTLYDVFQSFVYTTSFIATAMTTPDSNYDASASDFTWPNAKALWVMVIIGAGLIVLRIIYKVCMKMSFKNIPDGSIPLFGKQQIRFNVPQGVYDGRFTVTFYIIRCLADAAGV